MTKPLVRQEETLELIRALYERVATSYFTEFQGYDELEALGFSRFDGQKMIEIISNPIYMGKVPYSDLLLEHNRYAIVSEEMWYEANARLPAKRESTKKSKCQARWEEICKITDAAMLVQAITDSWFIRCPKCKKGKMRWDGVKKRAGFKVPQLACSRKDCNSARPALTSDDMQTLQPGIKCMEPNCQAGRREDFHHEELPCGKFRTTCKRCGWKCETRAKVFRHLDSKHVEIAPNPREKQGPQTKLSPQEPKPNRGQGRRASRPSKQ